MPTLMDMLRASPLGGDLIEDRFVVPDVPRRVPYYGKKLPPVNANRPACFVLPGGGPPADPYACLGLTPSASRRACSIAYRARILHCHPDRHPGLDQTSQAYRSLVAWTVALNRAYEQLCKV